MGATLAAFALAGCAGGDFGTSVSATAASGMALHGNVHGGQQPVTGAHVYLFAAGATGYASASTSLLSTAAAGVLTDSRGTYVVTDASGSFSLTGDWSCPHTTDQIYILVAGGNPGQAAGTNNSALVEMGALGTCSNLSASTFIVVNEVTTAAAATALQQFMSDGTHVGSSATNATGLANAFQLATVLANPSSGRADSATAAGNGSLPQATLNTLGNVLASCVNTTSASSSQCATLFASSTIGSSIPSDTLMAVRNIALSPTQNVAALYGLAVGTGAPFQPSLASTPSDWTLGINYSLGSGPAEPGYLAIDGSGNVWVTNRASEKSPYTASDSIVKLGPFGDILSGANGFTDNGFVQVPEGIAIDDLGNVWVASGSSYVLRMTTNGADTSGFPFFGGNYPQGIAVDKSGNAWVSNFGNGGGTDVMYIGKDGFILQPTVSSSGFMAPQGVALDTNGDIWVAGQVSSSLLKIKGSDFTILSGTGSGFTGGGLAYPSGLAIDKTNRAWVVNTYGGSGSASLSLFNNNGTAANSTGFSTVAKGYQNLIAMDGAGTAWSPSCGPKCVGSGSADTVVHLAADGTLLNTTNGFRTPGLDAPQGVGIDMSGNLWVANSAGQYNDTNGTVTEIVGVAAPVKTPIQAALKAGLLGQLP
ncbi:MAG: NHL repeat-containing protein [Acidobacteriota bacterium]